MGSNMPTTQGYGTVDKYRLALPLDILATSNGTPPTPVTRAPYRGYGYTIGDSSDFQIPIPKDFRIDGEENALTLYVRWVCNEAYALANGEVRWRGSMQATDQNGEIVQSGRVLAASGHDQRIPTTALQIQENAAAGYDGESIYTTSGVPIDTIAVSISRVALETGANPTAEPEIIAVMLECDRFLYWGAAAWK
jgi:hypothetical protein